MYGKTGPSKWRISIFSNAPGLYSDTVPLSGHFKKIVPILSKSHVTHQLYPKYWPTNSYYLGVRFNSDVAKIKVQVSAGKFIHQSVTIACGSSDSTKLW